MPRGKIYTLVQQPYYSTYWGSCTRNQALVVQSTHLCNNHILISIGAVAKAATYPYISIKLHIHNLISESPHKPTRLSLSYLLYASTSWRL